MLEDPIAFCCCCCHERTRVQRDALFFSSIYIYLDYSVRGAFQDAKREHEGGCNLFHVSPYQI